MKVKPVSLAALAVAAAILAVAAPSNSSGQAGADDAALSAVIDELSAQQLALVDNQAKIDARLATIGEDLRLARIFVARGGGNPPKK